MTVTIAPLTERDFFGWYALLGEYAAASGVELGDEQAIRIWSRLQEDGRQAVVAKDGSGQVVGLAHATVFERLLQGDSGLAIEDLFVAAASRGRGVATAMIEHVRTRAEDDGRRVLRWAARPDDPAAKALWDKFAASTDWALHDLTVG